MKSEVNASSLLLVKWEGSEGFFNVKLFLFEE